MDAVSLADDLREEGEPEREFHVGIAARMARKRVAAGALIHDRRRPDPVRRAELKPGLDIPGGIVEADEPPKAACRREVREELGLELHVGRLLMIDWMPAGALWSDALNLVFDGGTVDAGTLQGIALQDDEVDGVALLSLEEAGPRLRPSQSAGSRKRSPPSARPHPVIWSSAGRPDCGALHPADRSRRTRRVRGSIGMPVHDLPLAVLPAVDMRDAQRVGPLLPA